MTQVEKVLHSAKAHTTGCRDGGASRTEDGRLDVNPEQLFAAGWSACFLSAIRLAAGKKRIALPSGLAIASMVAAGALVPLATPSDAQTVSTAEASVNGSHEGKSRASAEDTAIRPFRVGPTRRLSPTR